MTSTSGTRRRRGCLAGCALGVLALVAAADGPPVELWTHVYDAGEGNDIGYGVAIDSEGSVLTAGYSQETLPGRPELGYNGFLRKRTRDGTLAWSKVLDNPATNALDSASTDQYIAVCVDDDDDVLVAGVLSGDYYDFDNEGYWNVALVHKYAADGTRLWEWHGDRNYGAWSGARAIDVDGDGYVYAAGNVFTDWGATQHQWGIWKLSPDGVLQPGYPLYHNQSSDYRVPDYAYGIAVRDDGSFVVVGAVGVSGGADSAIRDSDWHVRSYAANGTLQWSDTYSGPSHRNDFAFGVDVDAAGNAFVAGYANHGATNTDDTDFHGLLIKYSPTGTRLWSVLDQEADDEVIYRDVVLDAGGDLSVVGYCRPEGSETWAALSEGRDPDSGSLYGFTSDAAEDASAMLVGVDSRDDLIAVTGYAGVADAYDAFTVLATFESEPENRPPVFDEAPAAGTELGAIGEAIAFTVAAHDPDDDALTYTWDFGDGGFASGANVTHAFSTAGLQLVTVTVSDGLEEIVDDVSFAIGVPLESPSVKATLNFRKAAKDGVLVKCRLDLTDQLLLDGQSLDVDVGGVKESFTLSKKGKAKTDAGKVTLKYKKKQALWQLTVKLGKDAFADAWSDEGLVDETQKKTPVTMKVTVTLSGEIRCAHEVPALYTAKAGKWGKTK